MDVIALTTADPVDPEGLDWVESSISSYLGVETLRAQPVADVSDSWDPARGQYSSTLLLRSALERKPDHALKILVLTEHDLFIPMLTFVYGQAQLGGPAAIVSFARLRQEFYGLAADPPLFLERAGKETLHELGHTMGLTHCQDRLCAMSLSTNVQQLDLKRDEFCANCRKLLSRVLPTAIEPLSGSAEVWT